MPVQKESVQGSTGYWISRLARSMERDFEKRLKPLGISRGEYAVLSAIHHDKKNKPAILAAFLGLDGAAVTRYLDGIEAQGLIKRKPSPTDRRSTDILVTAEGHTVARRGRSRSKATNDKFIAGLSEAELDCFHSAIQAMLEKSDAPIAGF